MNRASIIGLACGLLLLTGNKASATGDSLRYLLPGDTLYLEVGPFGEKYGLHVLEPQQTLYSLARFYGLKLQDIYRLNPEYRETGPEPGSTIRFPIPNLAIKRVLRPGLDPPEAHVPLIYRVKKGDTMYRLARVYFRLPVETLLARAGLSDPTQLKPGQLIPVGWLGLAGITDDQQSQKGSLTVELANRPLQEAFNRQTAEREPTEDRGVATWQADPDDPGGYFALHRSAAPGTIIEVHNPMLNRWVYAKVVGKLSDRAYPAEVVVTLSPQAARALGALDPRFFVSLRYVK